MTTITLKYDEKSDFAAALRLLIKGAQNVVCILDEKDAEREKFAENFRHALRESKRIRKEFAADRKAASEKYPTTDEFLATL